MERTAQFLHKLGRERQEYLQPPGRPRLKEDTNAVFGDFRMRLLAAGAARRIFTGTRVITTISPIPLIPIPSGEKRGTTSFPSSHRAMVRTVPTQRPPVRRSSRRERIAFAEVPGA